MLLVLLFVLTQMNANRKLLLEEEENIFALTDIEEITEKFLEFRLAGTEFMILLQDRSKEQRESRYRELHEIFSSSEHEEISEMTPALEHYYQQLQQTATAFIMMTEWREAGCLTNLSKPLPQFWRH